MTTDQIAAEAADRWFTKYGFADVGREELRAAFQAAVEKAWEAGLMQGVSDGYRSWGRDASRAAQAVDYPLPNEMPHTIY